MITFHFLIMRSHLELIFSSFIVLVIAVLFASRCYSYLRKADESNYNNLDVFSDYGLNVDEDDEALNSRYGTYDLSDNEYGTFESDEINYKFDAREKKSGPFCQNVEIDGRYREGDSYDFWPPKFKEIDCTTCDRCDPHWLNSCLYHLGLGICKSFAQCKTKQTDHFYMIKKKGTTEPWKKRKMAIRDGCICTTKDVPKQCF